MMLCIDELFTKIMWLGTLSGW